MKSGEDRDNLQQLLNPRSVAIVGVSRDPNSFGYPLVEIAQREGYLGSLYLVNPNADTILGLKCYPSVLAIPHEVDLAMIMVPRKLATAVLEQCIEKNVKGIVIITAGFAEQSDEGRRHQEELAAKAVARGIRIIGPNTLGFFSAPISLDVMMSGFIRKGSIGLVTQSGNLTMSLTFPGGERGLGFSYVVDLGNQADVQAHDLIRFLREDSNTKAVAIHIEGLRDGQRFLSEVRETVKVKPVVVLKTGRTEAGARVVSSHTASIAGNDEVYTAALIQSGAIQVDGFAEFNSTLLAFNQGKRAKGNRVCVISEGGGDCALTADACTRNGLVIPRLPNTTQARLMRFIPKTGSAVNPVDLAGWENVVEATEIALEEDSIDGVIIVGGFAGFFNISPRDLAKEEGYVAQMCDLIERSSKPVVIYSYFGYRPSKLLDRLRSRGIPLFLDHHDAVKAMANLVRYERIRARMEARISPIPLTHENGALSAVGAESNRGSILEPEAKRLLRRYGLQCPEEQLTQGPAEAVTAASKIGFPVVLKIVSKDILHKSDGGCVILNLRNDGEVNEAFGTILRNARKFDGNAEIAGVLVSKMVTDEGIEIIIGGTRDPVFGPVVMFGLGGVFVETLSDVSLRVCPIDEVDAEEMVKEIKGYALLAGTRGRPTVKISAIKEALLGVSRMLLQNPHIAEVDLNPIKAHANGIAVLDARIITTDQRAATGNASTADVESVGTLAPDVRMISSSA